MSLPAVEPYSMPPDPEAGRVTWVPDPDRAVLLVHDMQEYFLDAYDRTAEPVPTLLRNTAELVRTARALGVPVVYTCQPGDQDPMRRGLLTELWGPGMSAGPHTAVVPELTPGPDDLVVTKWRYSAFERTELRAVLAHAGRDQLVVTGVYAHLGCQVTAADAYMADVQPFLVSDAVADFSVTEHERALEWVATGCGRVLDTVAVLGHLTHRSHPLRAVAEVATGRGDRYTRQLASHLGHKATVVDEGGSLILHLPLERGVTGMGRFGATDETVRLEVTAADEDSLATLKHVLGVHLERFGSREELAVTWG